MSNPKINYLNHSILGGADYKGNLFEIPETQEEITPNQPDNNALNKPAGGL